MKSATFSPCRCCVDQLVTTRRAQRNDRGYDDNAGGMSCGQLTTGVRGGHWSRSDHNALEAQSKFAYIGLPSNCSNYVCLRFL